MHHSLLMKTIFCKHSGHLIIIVVESVFYRRESEPIFQWWLDARLTHTLGARTLVKALKTGALLISERDPPSAVVGSASFRLPPRGHSHDGVWELLQGCSGRLLFHIGNLTLTAEIISTGECKQASTFHQNIWNADKWQAVWHTLIVITHHKHVTTHPHWLAGLAGHIKGLSNVPLVPQTENPYLSLTAVNGPTQIKCSMSQSCKEAAPFLECALERPSEKKKISDSAQTCVLAPRFQTIYVDYIHMHQL